MKIKSNLLKTAIRTLAIFAVIALVASCNSDDTPNYNISLIPIESVTLPEEAVEQGKVAELKIYYELESSCHEFDGFTTNYDEDEDEFLVGAVALIHDREDCTKYDTPKISNSKLRFEVDRKEDYVFKFWRGLDERDDPIYLTEELKVKKDDKDDEGDDPETEDPENENEG